MQKNKTLASMVAESLKKNSVRSEVFFRQCLVLLKSSTCPVITKNFEREIQEIEGLSQGCLTIERMHLMEKFKKASGVKGDLIFLHLVCISDTPILTFKEGVTLELDSMIQATATTLAGI